MLRTPFAKGRLDMELLSQNERQELIDLLCQLPGIEHLQVRSSLIATLPNDLQNMIVYINSARVDIASIVDVTSSDAWFLLPDGSYPLLVVLVNAINMVRGSQLESKLQNLMNSLRVRLGLPSKEIISPIPNAEDSPSKKTTVSGNSPAQSGKYLQDILHFYRVTIQNLSQSLLTRNWTELRGTSPVVITVQTTLQDMIKNLEILDRETKTNGINIKAILDNLNKALTELLSASILADEANVQYRLAAFDRLISCRGYLNLVVALMDF